MILKLHLKEDHLFFAEVANSDSTVDDTSESFAFALVNGALGVFEVHGRRIRDFRYDFAVSKQMFKVIFPSHP